MPLSLSFLPSFDRSLKNLDPNQRETIRMLLRALLVYYQSSCNLSEAQKIVPRFFYKQLRKPFYEAGIESKLRLIIKREDSKCVAILAGNHDQVKKFLTGQ